MTENLILVLLAFLLDLILGDPKWFPHPVRFVGWLIGRFEKPARAFFKNERLGGMALAIAVISITAFLAWFVIKVSYQFNYFLGVFVSIIFLWTTISLKSLFEAGRDIYNAMLEGDFAAARKELSMIVSRDTSELAEDDIIRSSCESIAENTSDGIIAPLFFGFLGGPVLALVYKAINTLDSMIGYKNESYINFGFFAAKLDDVANFIPARISGIIIPIAAFFSGCDWANSFRTMLRDRLNNPSPNSGYPEAAVSGALGVRFGGENIYFGKVVKKPFIGDPNKGFEKDDILAALKIAVVSAILFLSISLCISFMI